MNKCLLMLLILGLIFPVIYTKGNGIQKKQRDPTNTEESIDSADFWDFNPHADSTASSAKVDPVSSKKATVNNKKSTMNELEQILKDMESTLTKMGASTTTERILASAPVTIFSEEQLFINGENIEFSLSTQEEEFMIPPSGTNDNQDEGHNQEDDTITQDDTWNQVIPTEPETQTEDEVVPTEVPEETEGDWTEDTGITSFESQNTQAGTATLSGSIEYDMPFSTFNQQQGKMTFIDAIVATLGVDYPIVRVTNIREGSVIFDFEITLPAGDDTTKETSVTTLEDYANKLELGTKDGSLAVFEEATILDFQRKITVIAPVEPVAEVAVPKDDSLITVLIVIAAAVILGAIGWFVYKNKEAESVTKSVGKDPKYKLSATKQSDAERLDLESRGTASRSSIGEEINDKIKLYSNSPPSDSSL